VEHQHAGEDHRRNDGSVLFNRPDKTLLAR